MQSAAATVDHYLNEIPPERREILDAIRKLCQEELKGYVETMRYGMPCYEKNGVVEVSFASQKNSINLYILKKEVMDAFKPEGPGISTGKGCIRYSKPDKVDLMIVRRLLAGTCSSDAFICG